MAMGELFKAWRRDKGWTQAYVANRLGLSQSELSKIEAGDREPKEDVLAGFLELCGLSRRAFESGPPSASAVGGPDERRTTAPGPPAPAPEPPIAIPSPGPNPLRDILRLTAALASALYLAQETRTFLELPALPLSGFPPQAYFALLAGAFGVREGAAWWGASESLSFFEAEFIVVLWWLLFCAALVATNLAPGRFSMPPDLFKLAGEATAAILGARVSSGLRKAAAARRARKTPALPAAETAAAIPAASDALGVAFTLLAFVSLFVILMIARREPAATPVPAPARSTRAPAPPAVEPTAAPPLVKPPAAVTKPPALKAREAGFTRWLTAAFPFAGGFIGSDEDAPVLKPAVFDSPDGLVPGYEAAQGADGSRYFFPAALGAYAVSPQGRAGPPFAFAALAFPDPSTARPRLERRGRSPEGRGGLLLYPEVAPGLDLFFVLGPRIVRGLVFHESPPRLAVPGRRFSPRPAGVVFFLEGSAAARAEEPGSLGRPVVRAFSGPADESLELVGGETGTPELRHPHERACGANGLCKPVFYKVLPDAQGGWDWYEWYFDGQLEYPVVLLPDGPEPDFAGGT